MNRYLCLIFVCLSLSAHAGTIPKQINSLIKQYEPLNEICLSDDAEKPEIAAACDKRDLIYEKLNAADWCLGPYNLPRPIREWMSCTKMNHPERIRVFAMTGNNKIVTGDTIPARNVYYRLYLDKPCQMSVSNRENMRFFYWWNGSLVRVGCWFPTPDDGYMILYSNGESEKQPFWEMLPRATLNINGAATIIEPDYNSETADKKFMNAQWQKRMKMREQGMY